MVRSLYSILHLILLGLTFGATLALATPNTFDQKFNDLQKDMSTAQVKVLLGPPDLREAKDDKEVWHYNVNGGRRIAFDHNKVTEFGKDEGQPLPPTAAITPVPSPTISSNLEIGEDCLKDAQCKSRNCHFHTCSGLNNCSVPLGHVCGSDADCCGGKCDFQICKKR